MNLAAAPANAARAQHSLGGETHGGQRVVAEWSILLPRGHRVSKELAELDRAVPSRLRRIGVAKLRFWGLTSLADSAALLISELVTNAYQHGCAGHLTFRLCMTATHLCIEVDDGTPRRPMLRQAAELDESGRGLLLVDTLAESWGFCDECTTTWCALLIPAEEVSAC
jgi:anti-sigma regulatory factor (Ser/Thr protein kinase)